jgi:hypothetical protein
LRIRPTQARDGWLHCVRGRECPQAKVPTWCVEIANIANCQPYSAKRDEGVEDIHRSPRLSRPCNAVGERVFKVPSLCHARLLALSEKKLAINTTYSTNPYKHGNVSNLSDHARCSLLTLTHLRQRWSIALVSARDQISCPLWPRRNNLGWCPGAWARDCHFTQFA